MTHRVKHGILLPCDLHSYEPLSYSKAAGDGRGGRVKCCIQHAHEGDEPVPMFFAFGGALRVRARALC